MDAKSYLDQAIKNNRVVRFARWVESKCTGRGQGLILDDQACIGVLLEDCGEPTRDHHGLAAGAIVHYYTSPDAPSDQFRIVDRPAYLHNHHRCQRPHDWPPEE